MTYLLNLVVPLAFPASVETLTLLAMMGNGMMHNGMGWMMMLLCILGIIIALLLIVLLVLLIIYVARKMRQ